MLCQLQRFPLTKQYTTQIDVILHTQTSTLCYTQSIDLFLLNQQYSISQVIGGYAVRLR